MSKSHLTHYLSKAKVCVNRMVFKDVDSDLQMPKASIFHGHFGMEKVLGPFSDSKLYSGVELRP